MAQMLLIPDPRPLDRRLGGKFFRNAPRRPGVYLMKDAQDKLLYVGKAKDLKQRLGNYRLANPDRMPRRHLRMVNEVAKIEFQFCRTEAAALKHEKKLIRSLKPKFNRAGVWPGKIKFIVWQAASDVLELAVTETPQAGWRRFGPLNSSACELHRSLGRLLWLALNPSRAYGELPAGWAHGNVSEKVALLCPTSTTEISARLDSFFGESPDNFLWWLGGQFGHRITRFEKLVIESELTVLTKFADKQKRTPQLALI